MSANVFLQNVAELGSEISAYKATVEELKGQLTETQGSMTSKEQDLLSSHEVVVARITEEHRSAIGKPTWLIPRLTSVKQCY